MKIKRRAFVKGGAAAGGLAIASGMLRGNLLALSAKEPESSLAAVGEETVPTTCWIGKQDCGLLAHKVNGRLVKFEGNPIHPQNRGTPCPKGTAQISAVYDPNRVKTPLRCTDGKGIPGEFEQIS
jgi:thiosulfate reductase/polysulfide reductase chain A